MKVPTDPALVQWLREAQVPLMFETMLRALLKEKPNDATQFLAEFMEKTCETKTEETPLTLETQNVYIVRHGHRIDNFNDNWHATAERPYDPPLTDEGKQAAFDVGEEFATFDATERPTLVISSPFTRCLETAAEIAKGLGLKEINVHRSLGEIQDIQVLKHDEAPVLDIPASMNGVSITELPSTPPPFPEDRADAFQRYSHAFDNIPKEKPCNTVLVSHGEVCSIHYR
eukprot:TRINITY_DN3070_c0_g1_i1.p2 TRINITY_DN3070_c0_g1~~TRINITY_DN3070_c0_g1_i1.p2  ORF type:complete len:229 (+),score=43.63 TRINITY_DN3070_c0_g1_i1:1205-1891(+)